LFLAAELHRQAHLMALKALGIEMRSVRSVAREVCRTKQRLMFPLGAFARIVRSGARVCVELLLLLPPLPLPLLLLLLLLLLLPPPPLRSQARGWR
jgi:hypothetical protein